MDHQIMMSTLATSSNVQLSYLANGTWQTLNGQVLNTMDGIKIQTSSASPYYLHIGHGIRVKPITILM